MLTNLSLMQFIKNRYRYIKVASRILPIEIANPTLTADFSILT